MKHPAPWLLLLFAFLLAAARLRTYGEPLERDITIYAVIGREMLHGRALYSDLWDIKPPAIYATFAAAQAIAGPGRPAVYFMNVAAALATLGAIFVLGRRLGGEAAGLWGAGIWTLVSGDLNLWANQPNTEVFINACVAWGMAFLLSAEDSGKSRGAVAARLVLASALFAWASLYKQIAAVVPALVALAQIAFPPAGISRRRPLGDAAVIGGGTIAAWAAAFAWFAATGRYAIFRETLGGYGHYYAGSPLGNIARSVSPGAWAPGFFPLVAPLAGLTLLGVCLGLFRDRLSRQQPLPPREGRGEGPSSACRSVWLFAWLLGAHLAVALPGKFFPHYFQLWLPPLCVGAGWGVAASRSHRSKAVCMLGGAAMPLAFGWLLFHESGFYALPADEWSRRKYGELFVATELLGHKLDALLAPDETFFQWGDETGLYFASGRRPPTGVLYQTHLVRGPLAGELTRRTLDDLGRHPPDLLVFFNFVAKETPKSHPVLDFFADGYPEIAGSLRFDPFELYPRKGSAVEKRMEEWGGPKAGG